MLKYMRTLVDDRERERKRADERKCELEKRRCIVGVEGKKLAIFHLEDIVR